MKRRWVGKVRYLKKVIIPFAITVSVGIYYTGTEFLSPSRNVINIFFEKWFKNDYNFYSGNKLGNYYFMGNIFRLSSRNEDSKFIIENIETEGAAENLYTISSRPKSLGLIQEDTMASSMLDPDFIRDNVNTIAYLYTEKLHILYWPIDTAFDKNNNYSFQKNNLILKYKKSKSKYDETMLHDPNRRDELKEKALVDARYYLSHPEVKMNTGTTNSGSRFIVHALLNGAGVEGFEDRETSDSLSEAMRHFKRKRIQVLFFFTGTPLKEIQDALGMGAKLMSIKAIDFIKSLKRDHAILTRPAKFGSEYPEAENISTLGSRATLIASADVSSQALVEMLTNFKSHIVNLDKVGGRFVGAGGRVLPVTGAEIDNALQVVKAEYSREKDDLIRNVLLFFASWGAGTFLVYRLINETRSRLKKRHYYQEMNNVAKQLSNIYDEGDFIAVINQLQESRAALEALNADIADDYRSGGLRDAALSFLEGRVNVEKQKISRLATQHLVRFKSSQACTYREYSEQLSNLLSVGLISPALASELMAVQVPDSLATEA